MAPSGASLGASTPWKHPSGRARMRSSRTARVRIPSARSSVQWAARTSPRRTTSSSSENRPRAASGPAP
eukprot:3439716-Alexandrium_andersonii.AAC.1